MLQSNLRKSNSIPSSRDKRVAKKERCLGLPVWKVHVRYLKYLFHPTSHRPSYSWAWMLDHIYLLRSWGTAGRGVRLNPHAKMVWPCKRRPSGLSQGALVSLRSIQWLGCTDQLRSWPQACQTSARSDFSDPAVPPTRERMPVPLGIPVRACHGRPFQHNAPLCKDRAPLISERGHPLWLQPEGVLVPLRDIQWLGCNVQLGSRPHASRTSTRSDYSDPMAPLARDVHSAASDAQLKYHRVPLHEVGATPLHDARGR